MNYNIKEGDIFNIAEFETEVKKEQVLHNNNRLTAIGDDYKNLSLEIIRSKMDNTFIVRVYGLNNDLKAMFSVNGKNNKILKVFDLKKYDLYDKDLNITQSDVLKLKNLEKEMYVTAYDKDISRFNDNILTIDDKVITNDNLIFTFNLKTNKKTLVDIVTDELGSVPFSNDFLNYLDRTIKNEYGVEFNEKTYYDDKPLDIELYHSEILPIKKDGNNLYNVLKTLNNLYFIRYDMEYNTFDTKTIEIGEKLKSLENFEIVLKYLDELASIFIDYNSKKISFIFKESRPDYFDNNFIIEADEDVLNMFEDYMINKKKRYYNTLIIKKDNEVTLYNPENDSSLFLKDVKYIISINYDNWVECSSEFISIKDKSNKILNISLNKKDRWSIIKIGEDEGDELKYYKNGVAITCREDDPFNYKIFFLKKKKDEFEVTKIDEVDLYRDVISKGNFLKYYIYKDSVAYFKVINTLNKEIKEIDVENIFELAGNDNNVYYLTDTGKVEVFKGKINPLDFNSIIKIGNIKKIESIDKNLLKDSPRKELDI